MDEAGLKNCNINKVGPTADVNPNTNPCVRSVFRKRVKTCTPVCEPLPLVLLAKATHD